MKEIPGFKLVDWKRGPLCIGYYVVIYTEEKTEYVIDLKQCSKIEKVKLHEITSPRSDKQRNKSNVFVCFLFCFFIFQILTRPSISKHNVKILIIKFKDFNIQRNKRKGNQHTNTLVIQILGLSEINFKATPITILKEVKAKALKINKIHRCFQQTSRNYMKNNQIEILN